MLQCIYIIVHVRVSVHNIHIPTPATYIHDNLAPPRRWEPLALVMIPGSQLSP